MRNLFKRASDAIIREMKVKHPDLLSVADFHYSYWYSLEVAGRVSLYVSFDSAMDDLPKMISQYGLDHITLNVHRIKSGGKGECKLETVPVFPSVPECYDILRKTEFAINLKSIGSVEFRDDRCSPVLSDVSDVFLDEYLFIFFMDLPAYGSDTFVGWITRRSLIAFFDGDASLAYQEFLVDFFSPPASLVGIEYMV